MSRGRSSRPERSTATVSALESALTTYTGCSERRHEIVQAIAEGLLTMLLAESPPVSEPNGRLSTC